MRRCKITPPIVGLDNSLLCTAAVSVPAGWAHDISAVRSMSVGRPLKNATAAERVDRVFEIVTETVRFVREAWIESDPNMSQSMRPVVFIEGYAYNADSSSVTKLAELGGAMRYALARDLGIIAREMAASRARSYLLGKLPKGKGTQKPAVVKALRACGFEFDTVDEFDAMCVVNSGLAEVGGAGFSLPREIDLP